MKNRIPTSLSSEEAMSMAVDAYIYGYPLVLMDLTREVMTAAVKPDGRAAPINQFNHKREFPDPTFTSVVTPNVDTLYSTAWLDLSKEPMVLSVPAMKRYYLMQMLDAWTNVFASPGTRTTGNDKRDFAILGPGWKGRLPSGLQVIQSPTRLACLGGRTQTNGKDDFETVRAIQDEYQLTPLSAWDRTYVPLSGSPQPGIDTKTPPVERIASLDANAFFSRLNTLMKDNPPARADYALLSRCFAVGIAPGMPFDMHSFGPAVAEGLEKSVRAAQGKIKSEAQRPRGRNSNGWTILPNNIANFGTDYNFRSVVAMIGLGANLPEDAIYPHALVDSQERPLNGKNQYVIRFAKGQLPPVNAFWSITAYNQKQFLVPNPIGRHAIGDRDKLKYDPDGSLTIHVGHTSPGADRESNWLPAPTDSFNLFMRLYWPKDEALNGIWKIPGLERVGG